MHMRRIEVEVRKELFNRMFTNHAIIIARDIGGVENKGECTGSPM